MKLEFTTIDPETASPDEIRAEIEKMKQLSNEWKNEEQAVKILINSMYGALGNKWLVCFNPDVAETVTLQGQNLIKHAQKVIDHYFQNFWHKDTELHEKLGLKNVLPVKNTMVVYGDTDSAYVCYDEVIRNCDWKDNPKDLIIKINTMRLTQYLKGAFDRYAEQQGTANYQDFELENVSEAGIWLAKKKYLLNIIWQDGIDISPLSQITSKGVELVQSSTPPFAREKMKELIKFIFTKKKELKLNDIIALLRKYKEEFKVADPEKISMGRSISDYSSYILNDVAMDNHGNPRQFEIAKGTPIHVRAGGYYNYTLNSNQKYKSKYEMIKAADKIKFYHVKTKNLMEQDVFGYLPGSFPVEFAPPIDYDTQFAKTIIDPINRVLVAMGFPEVGSNLFIAHALF